MQRFGWLCLTDIPNKVSLPTVRSYRGASFSLNIWAMLFCLIICAKHTNAADIFIEPSFGGWYGDTRQSSWYGAYGEFAVWRKFNLESGTWYPGLDAIVSYNNGKTEDSGYRWSETTVGVGPVLQYFSEQDQDNKSWQWQGKALIEYEHVEGDNNSISYNTIQQSTLAYLYTEYIKVETIEWLWGLVADCRTELSSRKDSPFSGDQPDNRSAASINAIIQRAISGNLKGRVTTTGFYQGWDNSFGYGFTPELRINEKYMFGVKVVEISGDISFTGYMRLEFGKFPRPEKKRKWGTP